MEPVMAGFRKRGLAHSTENRPDGEEAVFITGRQNTTADINNDSCDGADHVINAARGNPVERVKELTGGLGPNMVIVTRGNRDSLQQAIEIAPRGSDIVFLAHLDDPVTADIGLAVQKGNSIFTVRGEGRMSVSQALSLMSQRKIMAEALVTHRFPLSRINEAIATFVERRNGAIKVVVHPYITSVTGQLFGSQSAGRGM